MRHLRNYDDLFEAQSACIRLRERGVLASISNEHSRTHSFITGAFSVELWAVLDFQYDDAMRLLANEDYEVERPLTEAEMIGLEQETKNKLSQELRNGKIANLTIIIVLVVVFMIVIYLKSVW